MRVVANEAEPLAPTPGWVRTLALLGVVLQGPLAVLAATLGLAGSHTGQHAGNAALGLAVPMLVAAVVAGVGLVLSLVVLAWSWATRAGRAAGWTWARGVALVVLAGWLLLARLA